MATAYVDQVQKVYIAYYGRPADPSGLDYWSNRLAAVSGQWDAIIDAFGNSVEAVALLANLTNEAKINTLYQQMFGRAAEPAGVKWYADRLTNGTYTLASIAVNILNGASGPDASAIANKLDAAKHFTNGLNTESESIGYNSKTVASVRTWLGGVLTVAVDQSSVDGLLVSISTFTLTPGLDNQTANTFFASETTLNPGDILKGAVGRTDNSLLIADSTAGAATNSIPAGVTLTNIQTVELNSAGNTAAAGFSTVPFAEVGNLKVTTAGNAGDMVIAANGAQGTVVAATHNGSSGGITVVGGTDDTVTSAGAGALVVGGSAVGKVPLLTQMATGAVIANQNSAGAGGVNVFGGTTVQVTTSSSANTGKIEIGNTVVNTGDVAAGAVANASGDITVANAGTGAITVFGGANVSVQDTAINGAGAITVGDIAAVAAANQASGNITITEAAVNIYDALPGAAHNNLAAAAIAVYGGQEVTVTTNAGGSVTIGADAANGANPVGNVAVTSTGVDCGGNAAIAIDGGANVTVSAAGAQVGIGQFVDAGGLAAGNPTGAVSVTNTTSTAFWTGNAILVDGGTTVNATPDGHDVLIGTNGGLPTGAVTVNQANVLTGSGWAENGLAAGKVTVDGGSSVTVNTTGGSVLVGQAAVGYPRGAVKITDTFSGGQSANTDAFTILGGTTVDLTTTATSGAITVGGAPVVDTDGVSLKNASQYSSGNVNIVNDQVNAATTSYGTGKTNVYSHGAATVSLAGGAVAAVIDANTILATKGAGVGQAIGASALTAVLIDGNSASIDGTTVASDALANLTITNDTTAFGAYTVRNAAKTQALKLTVGGNNALTVTDATAGTLVVTDNGKAFADAVGKAQKIVAVAATGATFTNTAAQSFDLTASTALTSLIASNSGRLNLGDLTALSKLANIDATKATGAITISKLNGKVTSFSGAGSTGNESVTLNANSLLHVDGVNYSNLVGGSGSNTIVANYAAGAIAGGVETDTSLGNTSHVKNFGTLALGSAATTDAANIYVLGKTYYDAAGFSALSVGTLTGDVTFRNAAVGATLAVTDNATAGDWINYVMQTYASTADSLPLTVGTATSTSISTTISANPLSADTGIENISITSNAKDANQINTVVIGDSGAKTVTISGAGNLKLTLNADDAQTALTSANNGTSIITNINAANASGAVDVSAVALAAAAGAGGGGTITGGSGLLTATGSAAVSAVDTIITGSGGGVITIGSGGSWLAVAGPKNGAYFAAGSETINLSASAAVVDTLKVADGAIATYNGAIGGVVGFHSGGTAADVVHFTAAKTVLAQVANPVIVGKLVTAVKSASAIDATGALAAKLANLTYTVSNGIITFGTTGGHQLGDFTSAELVSAVEIILNDTAANTVAALVTGGNTYVISDDLNKTLATNGGAANSNLDSIVELMGMTTPTGFGTTGAEGTIVSDNVTNLDSNVGKIGTAATLFDEAGFSADSITAGEFGTTSTSIINLAPSATLTLNDGGGDTQAVSINQTGSSGNNSLTLNLKAADTCESLTLKGDCSLLLNPTAANVIKSLADADNTLNTITVAGNNTLDIKAIAATGLKTIDASGAGAAFTLGDGSAISNDGLTIKLAVGQNSKVMANGAADVIGQAAGAGGVGVVAITASGAGDIITLSSTSAGNTITTLGAGDTINLGNTAGAGGYTVVATGSGDTINFTATHNTASTVTVGSNALVTMGGGNETIKIAGDMTGATSAGSYAFTTLKNATDGANEQISFAGDGIADNIIGATVATSQVNVALATTLAQALDVAANISMAQQPGTAPAVGNGQIAANSGAIDWFQYGGDTYIVEAVNNTAVAALHTSLGANDYVVKLTGLIDLGGGFITGGHADTGVLTL